MKLPPNSASRLPGPSGNQLEKVHGKSEERYTSGTAQAFRAVKRFHPDVVVSEIMQPQDLGFIRELHRRQPGLRILVFSMWEQAQYGAQARAAGASGYVMKEAGGATLVRNICSVLRGRPNGSAGTPKRA